MQILPVPTSIDVIWALSASSTYVRAVPDTTSDPTAASWAQGFPPQTFVDPGAGGSPPDGRDVNGAYQMLSAWTQRQCVGAPVFYNAGLSAAIGGYPKFAQVSDASTPGKFWISTADNNTNAPGGSDWIAFPPAAAVVVTSFNTRTGAVVLSSADVVSALATGALPLAKLTIAPAGDVLGNPGVSPAEPTWNAPSAFGLFPPGGAVLWALYSTAGYFIIPVLVSGSPVNLIVNVGPYSIGAGAGANVDVTFEQEFPTAIIGTFVQVENAAAQMIGTLNETLSGMTIQKGNAGSGDTNARSGMYYAIGY